MQVIKPLRRAKHQPEPKTVPVLAPTEPLPDRSLAIPDHDPLMGFLLSAGAPVELDKVELDSPALRQLRAAEIQLIVPLISQGELIGTLNLGRRLSDQPYSRDDRKLLGGLASQVAPAIRLAQMVKEQQAEAKERERIAQELRVAALIQQTLLPRHLPDIAGWEIDAYYRPARAVGGDFYDFIQLDDGRLVTLIGDVTDKGVPAALVMASCRSQLRAAVQRSSDPGEILAITNAALVDDIPANMFVTCLCGVLDPTTGDFTFANAGHNLPYVRSVDGVTELRATGMPLGLMPGMDYEVAKAVLDVGSVTVLSSDGLTEAHNPAREMLGFERLKELMAISAADERLLGLILEAMDQFTAGAEQEDDVTLVVLRRTSAAQASARVFGSPDSVLGTFSVPSAPGNERLALEHVAELVAPTGMSGERLRRLETAVAEASMNAMEHGNGNRPDLNVDISVAKRNGSIVVSITDHGGGGDFTDAVEPDLEAKLLGEQSPRGWGMFLIEQFVDQLTTRRDEHHHTIELVMHIEGDPE